MAHQAAAAGLIGVMITAIRTVHLPKGVWVTNGGYEYNLVLIAALASLIDGGPGELSADRRHEPAAA
jgi:putative oxidoreductase